MFLKKKLKEQSGAALIWAMCAATIVLILVGASMTLATAYHEKSLDETAAKQSYFSALSAAELVANEIVNGNTYASADELIENSIFVPDKNTTRENAKIMNVVFSADLSEPMGQCNVKVFWKNDTTLVIESDATYKEAQDKVSVELGYYSSQSETEIGNSSQRNIFGTRDALNATSNVVFKNTDIYLMSIDHRFKMDWVLNEGNVIYASKNVYQTFLDSLLGWFGGAGWFEWLVGDISMDDFTIITESDYNNVVDATVKDVPIGADIVNISSNRAWEIEELLENLEPGKIYVINYLNRNNQLTLDIGFSDDLTGNGQVYLVRPSGTRGAINIDSIEEGIELYYYGYDNNGQLNLGKNNSILNMFGGIYTKDDIKFMGDINYNGYLLLESNNPKLNFTGNTLFNVGYAQTSSLSYSWEIIKYNN